MKISKIALLFASIAKAEGVFDDIKMDENAHEQKIGDIFANLTIENSNNTIKLNLNKKMSHKDIIADHLLRKHLSVGAADSKYDDDAEKFMDEQQEESRRKKDDRINSKDLSIKSYDSLNFYTPLYIGSL